MISLHIFYYIMLALFAIIGAIRGLAKELVVTTAGVLVLVLTEYIMPKLLPAFSPLTLTTIKLVLLLIVAFIGYQTVNLPQLFVSKLEDQNKSLNMILGAVVGALNGHLFISSAIWFIDRGGYPYAWITPPNLGTPAGQALAQILKFAPPNLSITYIIVAVVVLGLLMIGAFH